MLRSWFLIPFSSLEERLILGLGQEIDKMSLRHLVVPESKEVLRTNNYQTLHHKGDVKGQRDPVVN